MKLLLGFLHGSTTNVLDKEAVAHAVRDGAADIVAGSTGHVDLLAITLLAAGLIAGVVIFYYMIKPSYYPRRLRRRIGVGPLTHFRNIIAGKISSFLP